MDKIIKNRGIIQIIYVSIIILLFIVLKRIEYGEVYNAVTAFLVIDVSNTERKNLRQRENMDFYNSISTVTRAGVCGLIAPLFYIIILGNFFGIMYMLIYNIRFNNSNKLFIWIWTIFTIIPSLIMEFFLYLIYICIYRKMKIDFKGDYFKNALVNPLLNVNILAAYVEGVNFYYYYNGENSNYFKCYVTYRNKIEYEDVKNYLSVNYIICVFTFIIFYLFTYIKFS
ncbi:hypothetical protein [Clostridium ganghwense]|uniref:Uncharacterized protein n=1 Tax=Clostridium ganghwense TaxID=312089 RepID=A0ABT4CQK3_9CLOT|nr:hypothetical protein [Clostridium ganghwense]MCY6370366.1 hypothetical protein [Clostridium ganghwense]